MNLCFFSGKIVSRIEFKFVISKNLSFKECKHISICSFKLQLENQTIITVKTYDKFAEFCYKNLNIGDSIALSGRISDNLLLEAECLG